MHYLLLITLVLALIYAPQWWVQHILSRYNRQDEDFPGTGGELARHLLDRFELEDIRVEATESGDHYDPLSKTVRLTRDKMEGRTLTAITTAAHEVGHAIQHANGYRPFRLRMGLARVAIVSQKLGSFLLFLAPLLAGVTRAPSSGAIMLLAAIITMGTGLIVQLITLPVEWDASFGKAMPILTQGNYIDASQEKKAKRILKACALTYVASSLAGLLNFWRWMQVLRR